MIVDYCQHAGMGISRVELLKQIKWKLLYFYSGISNEAYLQSLTFLSSEKKKSLAEAVKLLIPTEALYNFFKQRAGLEVLTFSISTSLVLRGVVAACLNLPAPQQQQNLNMPCILPNRNQSLGSSFL